jgi:hypothetical protein
MSVWSRAFVRARLQNRRSSSRPLYHSPETELPSMRRASVEAEVVPSERALVIVDRAPSGDAPYGTGVFMSVWICVCVNARL